MSLVLASASPRRLQLLAQIGITPDAVFHPDIDESRLEKEPPKAYVLRMAREKCQVAMAQFPKSTIIAADTVVVKGNNILQKANSKQEVCTMLSYLSNKRHDVMTAIAVYKNEQLSSRLVRSSVRFRSLFKEELMNEAFLEEGIGKAGGYAIQGHASILVKELKGSYSAVVGLPLYEVGMLLQQSHEKIKN